MKIGIFVLAGLLWALPLMAQNIFDPYSPSGTTTYENWQRQQELERQREEAERQERRWRALYERERRGRQESPLSEPARPRGGIPGGGSGPFSR